MNKPCGQPCSERVQNCFFLGIFNTLANCMIQRYWWPPCSYFAEVSVTTGPLFWRYHGTQIPLILIVRLSEFLVSPGWFC